MQKPLFISVSILDSCTCSLWCVMCSGTLYPEELCAPEGLPGECREITPLLPKESKKWENEKWLPAAPLPVRLEGVCIFPPGACMLLHQTVQCFLQLIHFSSPLASSWSFSKLMVVPFSPTDECSRAKLFSLLFH